MQGAAHFPPDPDMAAASDQPHSTRCVVAGASSLPLVMRSSRAGKGWKENVNHPRAIAVKPLPTPALPLPKRRAGARRTCWELVMAAGSLAWAKAPRLSHCSTPQ